MITLFKSLFRQAKVRPALSIMNLFGLAAGIATCTLIFLYAWSEMNFDSWVPNQDNLYRVEGHFIQSNNGFTTQSPIPLAHELLETGSVFKEAVRQKINDWPVQLDDFINLETVDLVDVGFLKMFPLEFVSGSSETAFSNVNNVVLNKSSASKYFGEADPIGQTLTINGNLEYTVTGVFEDVPFRSDMDVQILIPIQDHLLTFSESWNNISINTFATLKEGETSESANAQLAQIADKYRPFVGEDPGVMKDIFKFFVQPFSDIHLGSTGRTGAQSMGNYGMIYGFIAIATLVLIISAFNYVSLSTARALEREKEICLRKVMGAKRIQIIKQVMAESITLTAIASIIGLLIVTDTLPLFSEAVGRDFVLSDIYQTQNMAIFIMGTLFIGILSGLYPALFVSGFLPAKYLSSGQSKRTGLNKLRTGLVFVQFTVCIGLIIGAVAISKQIGFINVLDIGFNQDNLIIVRGIDREETQSKSEALEQSIQRLNEVNSTTRSRIVPLDGKTSMEGFYNRDILRDESKTLRLVSVDYDFFETYETTLLAGRYLSDQYANDKAILDYQAKWTEADGVGNVVLGEEAILNMGYSSPEAAIGEQILMWQENGSALPLSIVGVVKNVRFNSVRSSTQPLIFYHDATNFSSLTIRVEDQKIQNVLSELNSVWKDMYPNTPIEIDFMKDRMEQVYSAESQKFRLFLFFSGLTLLLSLVGLIGLVMNSVTHRKKEISIRRVVGASVGDIIKLFTWDYLKPVLLANIPSWIITWYFLSEWIEQYTQQVDLGFGLYLSGGAIILMVTLLVVTILVTRSALTPPVYALRHD